MDEWGDDETYTDENCLNALRETLHKLKKAKPNDRSEKDRRYAVTITELEKVYAYFSHYTYYERD